jgi:YbbR domain-containing protein
VLDANNNVEDGIVDVVTVAEPIMTKVVTKNVTLVGQPLVGRISELPLPVAVTISGTKTKLDELNDNLILMTADVEGLDLGSHQVPVKVDVPQEYTFIKTVPDTIEVVVEP